MDNLPTATWGLCQSSAGVCRVVSGMTRPVPDDSARAAPTRGLPEDAEGVEEAVFLVFCQRVPLHRHRQCVHAAPVNYPAHVARPLFALVLELVHHVPDRVSRTLVPSRIFRNLTITRRARGRDAAR